MGNEKERELKELNDIRYFYRSMMDEYPTGSDGYTYHSNQFERISKEINGLRRS